MAEHKSLTCDLPHCPSTTDKLKGWWAVRKHSDYRIEVETIGSGDLPELDLYPSGDGWKHYCGVQHALQAVSEAMEGCTRPPEPVIDLDAIRRLDLT